ncbi:unnamed protein product [Allacma fusca]|uniref:Uncharacterized protein n=1 Tax=Allacma fusca TaxID=39272 RepID=A0A8J2PD96_9HEXA|nr:unnamed protein product [Allacma fusca]
MLQFAHLEPEIILHFPVCFLRPIARCPCQNPNLPKFRTASIARTFHARASMKVENAAQQCLSRGFDASQDHDDQYFGIQVTQCYGVLKDSDEWGNFGEKFQNEQ